jgi:NAD dependent epimerase/dehydratase family enzyme
VLADFGVHDTLYGMILYIESSLTFCLLGVINGTAPNPVRLSELCERLGRIVGRPSWLPVPGFALKAVLGEGASVVTLISLTYYIPT